MSEEEHKVSDELFKDVKFYVVGDIDPKVRLWTLASCSWVGSMLTPLNLNCILLDKLTS